MFSVIAVLKTSGSGLYGVDLTPYIVEGSCTLNSHGPNMFSATLDLRRAEQIDFLRRPGATVTISVSRAGLLLWSGRMEQPGLDADGRFTIVAWGWWQAMFDIANVALLSDASYTRWRTPNDSEIGSYNPEIYSADKYNRLYIAIRKGESPHTSARCGWGYVAPDGHQANGGVSYIELDYSWAKSGNWRWQVEKRDASFGTPSIVAGPFTTGGAGTMSANFTNSPIVTISYFTTDASPGTPYASDTGTDFLRVTNVRVTNSTTAATTGDRVAKFLLAATVAVNAGLVSSSTVLIKGMGYDIETLVIADAPAGDILDSIAKRGDASGEWITGVDANRRLYLSPASTGRTYYVMDGALTVQPNSADLANSAYAVYRDDAGGEKRTATAVNLPSISRYGFTRMLVVSADDTTSATAAQGIRNTALAARGAPPPRVALVAGKLYNDLGGLVDPWRIQAGDKIVVAGLSGLAPAVASLTVKEIAIDLPSGSFSLEVTAPTTTLTVLTEIAVGGIGWRRDAVGDRPR